MNPHRNPFLDIVDHRRFERLSADLGQAFAAIAAIAEPTNRTPPVYSATLVSAMAGAHAAGIVALIASSTHDKFDVDEMLAELSAWLRFEILQAKADRNPLRPVR